MTGPCSGEGSVRLHGRCISTHMRWDHGVHVLQPQSKAVLRPHLGQRGVQLEYLALPFHLAHADLAGELRGGQAVPLQGERAVQGLLAATPDVAEGDLLWEAVVRAKPVLRGLEARRLGPLEAVQVSAPRRKEGGELVKCPQAGRLGHARP